MKAEMTLFEDYKIRRLYDEETEVWWFSVIDIVQVLTQQSDYQTARKYWNKLKERLSKEGSQSVTDCHRLKLPDYWANHDIKQAKEFAILTNIIHQEWADVSVKEHKGLKGLKSQNLRDHMSEAELIFTALAELSTRQIAETRDATGMDENTVAAKRGGRIAKDARVALEDQTGNKVVNEENNLPLSTIRQTKKAKPK